jgi:hypothetical protein
MARPQGSKNKPKEEAATAAPEPVVEPEQVAETPKREDEPRPTGSPHYQKRASILKEISDANKERYIADGESSADKALLEPDETDSEEEDSGEEEPLAATTEEPKDTPPKRKFTIDGVEKEFTEEQIAEYVQKHATADARLAEATRLREDAKRTSAATPAPDPATQLPAATSSAADVGRDTEVIAEITKALMYGEEEKVSEAVAKLLGKGRQADLATQTQGMTQQQIRGYIEETLAFERGKLILEDPPEKGGYADIMGDPTLRAMFYRREDELRDIQKDRRPYAELYRAIGNEIRTWRDALVEKHIPKTGLEDRNQRKSSTGVVRGAGGKTPAPIEGKPKSHEEKLASMRAARGLN